MNNFNIEIACQEQGKKSKFENKTPRMLISKDLPEEIQNQLHQQIQIMEQEQPKEADLLLNQEKLNSKNIVELHYAVMKYRQLLCEPNQHRLEELIQKIIDLQIIPKLIELIQQKSQDPLIIFEVTWIITNICCGTKEQIQVLLDNDGADIIFNLTNNSIPEISEQALWAMGNIVVECSEFRDLFLSYGMLNSLIYRIQNQEDEKFSKVLVWALATLCSGKPYAPLDWTHYAIGMFSTIIQKTEDVDILIDACQGLSAISIKIDSIEEITDSGVVPKLVTLLDHQEKKIAILAIKTIKHIFRGKKKQLNYILVQPIHFDKLLFDKNQTFVREVCQCIQKIANGTPQQFHSIIYNEITINQLLELMNFSKKHIFLIIADFFQKVLTKCSKQDAEYLISKGLCIGLSNLLYSKSNKDICEVLQMILNCLQRGLFFQENEGEMNPFVVSFKKINFFENRIKELQENDDTIVQMRSYQIWNQISQ